MATKLGSVAAMQGVLLTSRMRETRTYGSVRGSPRLIYRGGSTRLVTEILKSREIVNYRAFSAFLINLLKDVFKAFASLYATPIPTSIFANSIELT